MGLIHGRQQPVAEPGTGPVHKGDPLQRIDGPVKVTGHARYAAEYPKDGMVWGVVVNSRIAKGRIDAIDVEQALAVPGVLDVLTHQNRPKMRSLGLMYKDSVAPAGSPFKPLHDAEIVYSGQPVALVLAESFEAARYAATLVHVAATAQPHETSLMAALSRARVPSRLKLGFVPPPGPRGDADLAFAQAPFKHSGEYHAGVEHHNPLEMFASTVIRSPDGHLTVYDKTQGSQNSRWVVSRAFGLSKDEVTVRNPYVGGAFGSGLRPQYSLLLAVMAALHLKRSVRVVLTRQQMFTFGHRPETWQRVALAAEADGTLTSIIHEAVTETSRFEDFVEVVVNWSAQLYRCDNARFDYKVLPLDHHTPLEMRAPGAAQGVHALEVAMDELAVVLGIDPLALRLKNYSERDPSEDRPYSSKALRDCYLQAAERFGWSSRNPAPRARREGNELVGWGMATGIWDALQIFARAHAVLHADGHLVVSSAASDIGTGTYTVMSQIAAAAMGLALEQVVFQLGDSTLPVAPVEGGSSHVATVGSAIEGVCDKLKKTLLRDAARWRGSVFAGKTLKDVQFVGAGLQLCDDATTHIALTDILVAAGKEKIEHKYLLLPNFLKQRKYTRSTHSAVFCEVRVDEDFGTVRVTRVVSAIAAGRIINPLAARSQVIGGIVWGISQALFEETHTDHALGRFMNHSFADYHVPVNADIEQIEVIFADEDDRIVSRLGAKGVGEIGQLGVAAAVCNAVYHATGRRIRSTPMTPDKVMA